MKYQSLYRKWRPQIFEDIVGQKHITQTLMNAISLNRISHAYIFSGPRGVGKTTTARILAKSLNCKKGPTIHPCNRCENCIRITEGYSMDVIEVDGASNRGIDDIRDLRNKVKFAPAEGKYKVYIIDEVHMLTTEAFNALLKTLEEPPSHVIFVFATTAPHKIPKTILSRCQWFNFRRIPIQDILNKLKMISKDEELNIDDESLNAIARFSTGSMRDAESALDQVIAYCGKKIDLQSVRDVLGIIDNDIFYKLMEAIIKNEPVRGIEIINRVSDSGGDPSQFVKNLMEYVHNLSLVKYCTREAVGFRGIFAEDRERLLKQSSLIEIEKLFAIIDYLAEVERKMIYTHHPWVLLEMLVIKFTREKNYFFKEVEEDEILVEEPDVIVEDNEEMMYIPSDYDEEEITEEEKNKSFKKQIEDAVSEELEDIIGDEFSIECEITKVDKEKEKIEGSIRITSSVIDTDLYFTANYSDYLVTDIEAPFEIVKKYYGVKRYSIEIPELGEVTIEAMDRKSASKGLLNYLNDNIEGEITIAGRKLRKDNVENLSNYIEKELKEIDDTEEDKVIGSYLEVNPDGYNRPWVVIETNGKKYIQKLNSLLYDNNE